MFSKNDKFSFFWPEFEHVGEQPILNKELYSDFTDNKMMIYSDIYPVIVSTSTFQTLFMESLKQR